MEDVFGPIQSLLSDATAQASTKLGEILPQAVLAIAIVLAGWLIASVVLFLTVRILAFFAVDKLVGKTPLDRMLKSIGIRKSISEIIGLLLFWTTVLVTLIYASEFLQLESVSKALTIVTLYIPKVVAALLIIIFGMLLGKFLQTLVTEALARANTGYEKSAGKAVYLLVIILVLLAASRQLGLNLDFITTNVMLVLLGFVLIVALALVIGMRTVLENMLACHHLRNTIAVGKRVEINGIEGTMKEWVLTGVVLETKDGDTIVPATFFFKHSYTLS